MPCSDNRGPEPIIITDTRQIKKLESMLCSSCRVLKKLGYDFDENPRLSEWWERHQEADAKADARKERVRIKKQKRKELVATLLKMTMKEIIPYGAIYVKFGTDIFVRLTSESNGNGGSFGEEYWQIESLKNKSCYIGYSPYTMDRASIENNSEWQRVS